MMASPSPFTGIAMADEEAAEATAVGENGTLAAEG